MLTAISYACDPLPVPPHSTFQVRWSPWDGNKPRGGMERIPTELLGSALPAAEATRDELQKGLAQGWGPWMHASMLDLVKLPEAAVVTTQLCTSGGEGAQCIQTAQPDGHKQNAKSAYVRVGHHAYDRSYVQYYLGHSSADQLPLATNVSVEYSVSKGGSELDLRPHHAAGQRIGVMAVMGCGGCGARAAAPLWLAAGRERRHEHNCAHAHGRRHGARGPAHHC